MKKATNVKVGDVIQFPHHCFASGRKGWNGWTFKAGIVEKLYTNKNGLKIATVKYCTKRASRYALLPNVEAINNIQVDLLFEYDIDFAQQEYLDGIECEKNGDKVCWTEDIALLVNHGIVK